MDEYMKILQEYSMKFNKCAGILWNKFLNAEIELEYWDTLKECIDSGVPLTKKQRKYFGFEEPCPPDVDF